MSAITQAVHGTANSYNNAKCRCPECKTAWAIYLKPRIREYRAAKKEAARLGVPLKEYRERQKNEAVSNTT